MDSQNLNRLDSLPTEISSQILEELLALHKTDGSMTLVPSRRSLPKYVLCPNIQPQVLRVSKRMHAIGKDVLERSNKWIVVDMDCAYLLTVWASAILEMIMVDPESAQDLPSGMMHIRVKPYTMASGVEHYWNHIFPRTTLKRQILLLPASQLGKFVSALRITEVATTLRRVHGDWFKNRYTDEEYQLKRGEHGLSILIHVNEGYPSSLVNGSLEEFRRLHGPLNEISIVGAVDEQQARSIEASIPLPRDVATDSTLSEVVVHVMDLIGMAHAKIQEDMGPCVPKLYEQARAVIINSHSNDKIPWGGWVPGTAPKDVTFEMLALCAGSMNLMAFRMISRTNWLFPSAEKIIAWHLSSSVQALLQEPGLRPELPAYVYLLNGLNCVLSARVGTSQSTELSVISHGLDLITRSEAYATQMPDHKTYLFRAAYKMHDYISRAGLNYKQKPKIEAYIAVFFKFFSEELKHVKWRVHESHVPKRLRDKGALGKMQKESLLSEKELQKYLIVDTMVVKEGAEGEFYLL